MQRTCFNAILQIQSIKKYQNYALIAIHSDLRVLRASVCQLIHHPFCLCYSLFRCFYLWKARCLWSCLINKRMTCKHSNMFHHSLLLPVPINKTVISTCNNIYNGINSKKPIICSQNLATHSSLRTHNWRKKNRNH